MLATQGPAATSRLPHLCFEIDGSPQFAYSLGGGRTVLGRADSCDVALPSEKISRVHCFVEQRGEGWWLIDRSSNGTLLNGLPVQRRAQLKPGDLVGIGDLDVRFLVGPDTDRLRPTESRVCAAVHEEPVGIDGDGLTSCRVALTDTSTGRSWVLKRQRSWLGGPGADIEIDPHLAVRGCRVHVVRGRPMVEAGEAAAFVAGQRVRETVPIYPGESLRIGDHTLVVEHVFERRGRERERFGEMVGAHPAMKRLFGALEKAAAHDHAVLLVGESGTGKELAARALHDVGPRADGPYVALNVAALSESLFESEMFGHEKGAFTGATSRQAGAFQRADGGTLFLDEIGELALPMQAKLLRTLESGEVRRVGGGKVEYPDVRIVAATNRDLPAMVAEGTFRSDLYFRLSQLPVRLPPLRGRRTDILPIAQVLLHRIDPKARLLDDAAAALEQYDWPGNVRELRNVLTRAAVLGGPMVSKGMLQFEPTAFGAPSASQGLTEDYQAAERQTVLQAMRDASGNKARAARILGMPRSTLTYKLKRLGLV
ncbi:MAG: sigma 54-interacting transcriptional regulator [Proteobacteria bacterium]|nr:sigma 54-interacting transcriptional regulator [Pseudomonadota bacterium]